MKRKNERMHRFVSCSVFEIPFLLSSLFVSLLRLSAHIHIHSCTSIFIFFSSNKRTCTNAIDSSVISKFSSFTVVFSFSFDHRTRRKERIDSFDSFVRSFVRPTDRTKGQEVRGKTNFTTHIFLSLSLRVLLVEQRCTFEHTK